MSFISASVRSQWIQWAIGGKSDTVVFTKPLVVAADGTVTPETILAAQVVRIEPDNRPRMIQGVAGLAPKRGALVIGVVDHPTVADTIMEEGFTFVHDGGRYRISEVVRDNPGELKGVAVVDG